ncbi:MAG: phosphotransferase [Chloroflexota bacterium]
MSAKSEICQNQNAQDEQLKQIVADHYDLGELLTISKIPKGMVNQSYKIETLKHGKKEVYLFRHYHPQTTPAQIRFEHALLIELQRRNFALAPQLIERRNGKSYLKTSHYVAIFSFLSGESKYEWNTPLSTQEEFGHVAKELAFYHQTISGWKSSCHKPKFIAQIPAMMSRWRDIVRVYPIAKSSFERYFLAHYNYLNDVAVKLKQRFDEKLVYRLPEIAVHGDYHAGNLLFQDDQVSGILDFNHSNIDYRLFDIGLALMYFCANLHNANDEHLSWSKIEDFLRSYQQAWRGVAADSDSVQIGSLNRDELRLLPEMILAAVFFDLDWLVNDYYTNQPNTDLYLPDLQHFVRMTRWVEAHWHELAVDFILEDER